MIRTFAIAMLSCLFVSDAAWALSPFYDAAPSTVGTFGGNATGDLDLDGFDIIDADDIYGQDPTTDTAPGTRDMTGSSAYPASTGANQTGGSRRIAAGQGVAQLTFTATNCATDTITITLDGSDNVFTEGTHWNRGASDSAACSSARAAVIGLSGIDATGTTCGGAGSNVLRIGKARSTLTISVAASDATCAAATNGTDGTIQLFSTMTTSSPITTTSTLSISNSSATAINVTPGGITCGGNFTGSGDVRAGQGGAIYWQNRGGWNTPSSGLFKFGNNNFVSSMHLDVTTNNRLRLGSSDNLADGEFVAKFVTATGSAFASLGSPSNGTIQYCSDCTKATPCASGGSGAIAKRINGAWDCN